MIRNCCENAKTVSAYVREGSAELGNGSWSEKAFCDVAVEITRPHATQTSLILGIFKENAYVPQFLMMIQQLKAWVTAACAETDHDLFRRD